MEVVSHANRHRGLRAPPPRRMARLRHDHGAFRVTTRPRNGTPPATHRPSCNSVRVVTFRIQQTAPDARCASHPPNRAERPVRSWGPWRRSGGTPTSGKMTPRSHGGASRDDGRAGRLCLVPARGGPICHRGAEPGRPTDTGPAGRSGRVGQRPRRTIRGERGRPERVAVLELPHAGQQLRQTPVRQCQGEDDLDRAPADELGVGRGQDHCREGEAGQAEWRRVRRARSRGCGKYRSGLSLARLRSSCAGHHPPADTDCWARREIDSSRWSAFRRADPPHSTAPSRGSCPRSPCRPASSRHRARDARQCLAGAAA